MDQRVGKLWVEALESGEYKSTTGLLARVDPETNKVEGYCCLGVLEDLAVKEGIIPPPIVVDKYEARPVPEYLDEHDPDRLLFSDYDGNTSTQELTAAVREWAGLDDTNPNVSYTRDNDDYDPDADPETDDPWTVDPTYTVEESLAEINDGGASFTEIAQLIKDQLMSDTTAPTFAIDPSGEITEKSEEQEAYVNQLVPVDSLPVEEMVEAVLSGTGTFVGGDADTNALLYGMRRAFLSGVRYGSEFLNDDSDDDELDAAFDVFVLSEIVFAQLLGSDLAA